jgi:antitoxin CptB
MKKQDQGFHPQGVGRAVPVAEATTATLRIQDAKLGAALPNPESKILSPETARRLHWRCRRGLLELDIVLGRFIETHYAQLDEAEQRAFDVLLDMPDTVLWDMVAGRQEAAQNEQRSLLEMLKAV